MNFDPQAVQTATRSMKTLGQVLTALGILAVIFGAVTLIIGLVTELRGLSDSGPVYGLPGVIRGAWMLFSGLILSAGGALLQAIRSMAVNLARLADGSKA